MPPKNRRITDFWKPGASARSSQDDGDIRDNIVVGGSKGSSSQESQSRNRPWPSFPKRRKVEDEVESHKASHQPSPETSPRLSPQKVLPERLDQSSPRSAPVESPTLPSPQQSPHEPTSQKSSPPFDDEQTTAAAMQPSPPNASLTSSLTTLSSTFVSFTSTSSKRISIDGVEAVLNSDSDSELEDIGALLAKGPSRPLAKPQPIVRDKKATSARANSRFSLEAIVARHDREKAAEKEVAQVDARWKVSSASDSLNDSDGEDLDEEAIAAILDDDEGIGKRQKVAQAIQRTEALTQELGFNFFDEGGDAQLDIPPFPVAHLPAKGWATVLRHPAQRDRTFSSGLALRLSEHKPLPDEILQWMVDAACTGTRELLSFRYAELLREAHSRNPSLLESEDLDTDFVHRQLERMGARKSILDSTAKTELTKVRAESTELPSGLRWLLEIIRHSAAHLSVQTTADCILILSRLSLDDKIRRDGLLGTWVHDTIAAVIEGMTEAFAQQWLGEISKTIVQTMPNPILQLRLIQAFPAASHRCHRVRRKLALAFALSDKQLLEADLEDPFLFDRVSRHLSHLTRTAHSADHAALGATIELLDIGVDAGFSNRNFTIDQHAEKSFNKRVSELAKAVKELDSRLIGSGLSSLSKHTTKATLDRLGGRLQYAVRTKPPAKSGFLGPTAEEEERTVKWMSKWVNKEKDGPVKKDDVLLKQNVQAGDPTKAEELESTETLQLRPACFGVHLTPAG